jgi:uncharacterized protein involved in exopolysaccharide biosynthesis
MKNVNSEKQNGHNGNRNGNRNGNGNGNGHGNGKQEHSFTLRDLVGMAFRRRRVIVLAFAGLMVGSILAILILPPTYEAEMKILVQRERVDPLVSTEPNVNQSDRNLTLDEITSEVELFQSRDSLEKTILDCRLYEPRNPWSIGAIELRVLGALGLAPDKQTRIYKAVLKMETKDLQVIPLNASDIIKVTYQSESPQLAAQVLKELGDLYLAKHTTIRRPQGTADFFQQQAQQYEKELAASEGQLVRFTQQTGVVSADFEKQVTLQKMNDFDLTLQQTLASIAETEKRLRTLEAEDGAVPARVTTQIKVADNPLLMANLKTTLLDLELKRTELLERYDPTYPLVQEVETKISETRTSIAEAERRGIREETTDQDPAHAWVKTEMEKAKADLTGLRARASAMAGGLKTLESRVHKLEGESIFQQDLLRTAKANEENYLLYHRKREEARIADALDQRKIINAAVAEAPMAPLVPASLPTGVKLLLAVVIAILGSMGLGFLMEYLDPSFRTPEEVKEYLEIPLLATLPKNNGKARSAFQFQSQGEPPH